MADDRLTTLYNWSEEMTKAAEQVGEKHEENYKLMIEYVKTSDTKERVLSAQLIARFFKYFPTHEEAAFDSIVDLCESVDVNVRKHATMAMISICRDCKHLVSKAADILIQLYQTNQASEINLINQSLTTLLNLDIQKFLQSFFTNFEDGTEVVRERALKFLSSKLLTLQVVLSKDVEEQIMNHSMKAMEDVTKNEFITFIGILTKLKIAKTVAGQATIVNIIKSQAELVKEINVEDTDALDKFLLCTRSTIPLLSQYNRASEYISYICLKILPHLTSLESNGNDLSILQTLAEMSPFIHINDVPELIDLEKCQQAVYGKLLEYLPLPSQGESGDMDEDQQVQKESKEEKSPKEAETANGDKLETSPDGLKVKAKTHADFQFTHIEYILYTFQQFGRIKPEFFNTTLQAGIRLRLLHLANGCSKYMQILSSQLRGVKNSEDLKKEENKLKSVALRTTKNITSIIVKDLFQKPPQFKTNILLSCKPLTSRPIETAATASSIVGNSKHNINNNNNQNKRMKRFR